LKFILAFNLIKEITLFNFGNMFSLKERV